MLVYEKVKYHIDKQGLRVSAVAKDAGISSKTLNALLNGKKTMYPEDLRSICYALRISAATFIDHKSAVET